MQDLLNRKEALLVDIRHDEEIIEDCKEKIETADATAKAFRGKRDAATVRIKAAKAELKAVEAELDNLEE